MKESRVLEKLLTDGVFLANEHLKKSTNMLILPKIARSLSSEVSIMKSKSLQNIKAAAKTISAVQHLTTSTRASLEAQGKENEIHYPTCSHPELSP